MRERTTEQQIHARLLAGVVGGGLLLLVLSVMDRACRPCRTCCPNVAGCGDDRVVGKPLELRK